MTRDWLTVIQFWMICAIFGVAIGGLIGLIAGVILQ
jgi:hypothetical protein